MTPEEVATALGSSLVSATTLAGGFSHRTELLQLADRAVVARFGGGGGGAAVEAAVMARAPVAVPEVLRVFPDAMAISFVTGTALSEVLASAPGDVGQLGHEVGRVVADIGSVTFERPGFFADDTLHVKPQPPWSAQLAEFAEGCMASVPADRLDLATRTAWARLCAEHAPELTAIDDQAQLVHGDVNPKNILVSRGAQGWRVDAVLDWEFAYAGCPYGDAANMVRFGAGYPAGFLDGFAAGFSTGRGLPDDWQRLGGVLDMFALSDLVTRPPGHEVADQAAAVIRARVYSSSSPPSSSNASSSTSPAT